MIHAQGPTLFYAKQVRGTWKLAKTIDSVNFSENLQGQA